jgi:hypothetical protein
LDLRRLTKREESGFNRDYATRHFQRFEDDDRKKREQQAAEERRRHELEEAAKVSGQGGIGSFGTVDDVVGDRLGCLAPAGSGGSQAA